MGVNNLPRVVVHSRDWPGARPLILNRKSDDRPQHHHVTRWVSSFPREVRTQFYIVSECNNAYTFVVVAAAARWSLGGHRFRGVSKILVNYGGLLFFGSTPHIRLLGGLVKCEGIN